MHQVGEDQIDRLMEMEPAAVVSRFRSGQISRRDMSKLFAALGLTTALGPVIGQNSALAQSNDLTMIVWEGYTSDSFTIPWEEANDVNVEATFAGTGDEMFAAMKGSGGTTYDMVSASSDLPQRLYDADLLIEIDASKLTNYPDLYEQFQRPPYITFDDKLYGVNFSWGPTIMLYNPDSVA
jgi:spermidine/putrescine-binding protein